MEPLFDKLARQKAVRGIIDTIRTCDKQSDRLANTRATRFIVSMICAMFAPVAIFLSMLIFTDWDTPSFFGNTCFIILLVAEWPLVLCSFVFMPGNPPMIVCIFLYVISGLFWASIADLVFVWRKRYVASKIPRANYR
jgi:hypothetical protein